MRFVVDENMPLLSEFFGDLGEIVHLPGRAISRADLLAADALLVRSVTRVDRGLLEGTAVRFVGTATIGTDHIDKAGLAALGITVASAPGCNARAVGEYVATVLATLADEQGWQPQQRTLGVIGLGNTGCQVMRLAAVLGFRVLGCDPFVSVPGIEMRTFTELLAEADIVSLHVPLTSTGPHPTHHLFGAGQLASLRSGSILINSSRGEVVDNPALEHLLQRRPEALTVVLDVWEGEPTVRPGLLERVRFGTPHVAGYSQEGKWRGTEMIYRAFCAAKGMAPRHSLSGLLPSSALLQPLTASSDAPVSRVLRDILQQACPLRRDDAALRASVPGPDPAAAFDALRKSYPSRREFTAHAVALPAAHPASAVLAALGFQQV
ncbi:MAG: 4-phosphoerythronate dehydrogenase [bacterium]|nr:4-phosphoerythronate dehydrogenase [bacterium]